VEEDSKSPAAAAGSSCASSLRALLLLDRRELRQRTGEQRHDNHVFNRVEVVVAQTRVRGVGVTVGLTRCELPLLFYYT
jgi:hypothetical protein